MLKFAIVELQRIDLVWAIPLLALVHLAWLIQGARVLAMLLTGNWDGKPMVYPPTPRSVAPTQGVQVGARAGS